MEYWSRVELDQNKGDKIFIVRKNYMISGTITCNCFDPKLMVYKYFVLVDKIFARNKEWEKKLKKLNIIP